MLYYRLGPRSSAGAKIDDGAGAWRSDASLFFFFQAEDGIRDDLVTGVQTCALPIYPASLKAISFRGRRARRIYGDQVLPARRPRKEIAFKLAGSEGSSVGRASGCRAIQQLANSNWQLAKAAGSHLVVSHQPQMRIREDLSCHSARRSGEESVFFPAGRLALVAHALPPIAAVLANC